MSPKQIFKNFIEEVKTELSEEFDQNFERKAFFNRPWMPVKKPNQDTILNTRANLRRSISNPKTTDHGITWTSSVPYASIHNEGGTITVTPKMKKFFWAMYYKASGAITKKKDGSAGKTKRNALLSVEAQYWKNMALMKVGSKIKIPQRQFIGNGPEVDRLIRNVADDTFKKLEEYMKSTFKKH